jgi:hypothetical protein
MMPSFIAGGGRVAWRESIGNSGRLAVVVLDLATQQAVRFEPPQGLTTGRVIAVDARELLVGVWPMTPGRSGIRGRIATWRLDLSALPGVPFSAAPAPLPGAPR